MGQNLEYKTGEAETHARLIRSHLEAGNSITALEALKLFGCFRLGARIWDLRHKDGLNIVSTMKKLDNGKRIAEYRLAD